MAEFVNFALGIDPEPAFGDPDTTGYVEVVSCGGDSVGLSRSFEKEAELQEVEIPLQRKIASRIFLFIAREHGEDVDGRLASPGVFLARVNEWTSHEAHLRRLQENPLQFDEHTITNPLDDSPGFFSPRLGAPYGVLNRQKELVTAGIGFSSEEKGYLLALEGTRRTLVLATPASLVQQASNHFGGEHTLHGITGPPRWLGRG